MHKTTIGAALFIATAALLLADHQWHLFAAIPVRALAKAAKGIGSLALLAGAAAIGAYAVRLLLGWTAKNRGLLPPAAHTLLQTGGKVVRLWHPLLGALAVSLAAIHGYVLFFARPEKQLAVYSGVALIFAALLIAGAGWRLHLLRGSLPLRKTHTYLAFTAAALVLLHMALAD